MTGADIATDAPVHVLFCADRGYFPHMAVAAVSLAAHTRRRIHVHVLTCDDLGDLEPALAETLAPHPHVTWTIRRIEDARLATLFVDKYLTKEAYLRFLAPEVLPPEVGRVVYLDCDLVVLDDIGTLADADLRGQPLAAVADLDWWGPVPEQRLRDLGLRPGHRYVNSGVLVLDLEAWRRERIAERLFAFAAAGEARLTYHDQDAINVVLQGRIVELPRRWNVQTLWSTRFVRRTFPAEFAATAEARARPAILHFSSRDKPWKFRAFTRRRGLYFRFRDRTPWRDAVPAGLTALQRGEYRLSRRLLGAGIDLNAVGALARRARALAAPAAAPEAAPAADGTVHVMFCADRGYLQHVAAAAVSVAEGRRGRPLAIHVLTCDAASPEEDRLRASLAPYAGVTLAIHRADADRLDRLFVDRHVTREAYLRFLAPELLPAEVARVIYLDADLVALDDVAGLWAADLDGKPVAAVQEVDWSEAGPDTRAAALGIAPGHVYVNSGVLVMDLAAWRRDGLCQRLLDCAAELGPRAVYWDQDALNVALQGEIALLDRRWNVQTLMLGGWYGSAMPRDHAASAAARHAPGIVHFSTGAKPWKFRARTRRRADYLRFRARTAWRDEPPPGLSRRERAEHAATTALLRRGIDLYPAAAAVARLKAVLAAMMARRSASDAAGGLS